MSTNKFFELKTDSKKRKSDHLEDNSHQNGNDKKIKSCSEVIELTDDSDELKIIDEIKKNASVKSKSDQIKELSDTRNPLGFYLSKVLNGIDESFNNEFTLTIKDILSQKFNKKKLKSSCQFSYLFDVDWLVNQYDETFRKLPLTIVAQQKQPTVDDMKEQCKKYSNIDLCFAKLLDQFGTHHTKMMLLEYEDGLRVVIHTSNLRAEDWAQKTQGLWLSELLPKLDECAKFEDKSKTGFQTDLIEYLTAYNCASLRKWISIIKRHDFSSVNVFLIGSIPGRHREANKLHKYGHMKLRKILQQQNLTKLDKDWMIIAQFSSIGTLGKSPDTWLTKEFLDSLKASKKIGVSSVSVKPAFKIVFPTVENVRKSLEGYMAGASIPYQNHVAIKQPYLKNFMHQWKSDLNNRSKAQPHIKTYTALHKEGDEIAYFLLTSANLSKAAWGTLEKNSTQLNIRSYELGVLFLPEFHGTFSTFKRLNELCLKGDGKTDSISMFLPFDYPLQPYSSEDRHWITDLPYDQPDSHGCSWHPK